MARQEHKIIDPPGQRLTMKYAAFLHKAGRIKTMPEGLLLAAGAWPERQLTGVF
jgi:hypothetical protein